MAMSLTCQSMKYGMSTFCVDCPRWQFGIMLNYNTDICLFSTTSLCIKPSRDIRLCKIGIEKFSEMIQVAYNAGDKLEQMNASIQQMNTRRCELCDGFREPCEPNIGN